MAWDYGRDPVCFSCHTKRKMDRQGLDLSSFVTTMIFKFWLLPSKVIFSKSRCHIKIYNLDCTEKLLLKEDASIYHFINQGCLTVDGMNDKEEMKLTDVCTTTYYYNTTECYGYTCICIQAIKYQLTCATYWSTESEPACSARGLPLYVSPMPF